jgi:outer membrane biosynthesis protein TonB
LGVASYANIHAKETSNSFERGETLSLAFSIYPNGDVGKFDVLEGNPNSLLCKIAVQAVGRARDIVGPIPEEAGKQKQQAVDMVIRFSSF